MTAEIAGELRAGRVKRQTAQLARHGIGKEQDDFGDTVVDALDIQRPAQGFALGWVWRIERESPCATEDHADRPASHGRQQVECPLGQRDLSCIAPNDDVLHIRHAVAERRQRHDLAIAIEVFGGRASVGTGDNNSRDETERKHLGNP